MWSAPSASAPAQPGRGERLIPADPDRRRLVGGVAGLLLASLALLLPGLRQAPFERAEIYFLDAARAMLESGDWLVPHYRGEPFFDKPVLSYWLMAAAFGSIGVDPGAARLVPVAAAFLTLLGTWWLGTLLFDRRTGFVGSLVLLTTIGFAAFGRVAMSDMLLTLWSTLTLALGVRALRGAPLAWPVALLGASLGLGFLTKGPVAVLLPAFGLVLLALWQRSHLRSVLQAPALAGAALLFAVLGLGWFAALYWRLGTEPLTWFFLHENLERFAGRTYDAGQPAWFYPVVYAAEGLPWSLFLPLALWRSRRDPPARLLMGWLVLMLVPLSVSRGKLDYYLLPLYPAASLLVARVFAGGAWASLERQWARGALAVLGLTLASFALFPMPLPKAWLPPPFAVACLRAVLASSAVVAALLAWRPSARPVAGFLMAAMALPFVALTGLFLPAFRAAQPNAAIVEDVGRELRHRPDAHVVLCEDPSRAQRDILFHVRAPVLERCDLWTYAASDYPYLLLVDPRERKALSSSPYWRRVARYDCLPGRALSLRHLLRFPQPEKVVLMANFETEDPIAVRKQLKLRRRALRTLEEAGLPRPEPD